MKKWISLIMALLLMITAVCALAEETGSIRHEVTGDVSEFVVDETAGLDQAEMNDKHTEATLGTDVYLFVDPDTASYVTFQVTDVQGDPVEGALIYITYNGITELYGVTDENGQCSMYLFRNVEYGFEVTKFGYESAQGRFSATAETKLVRVVLRKLHVLTVYVTENGTPLEGVTVLLDGVALETNALGRVRVKRPNGEYSLVIITPDGRKIPAKVVVNGETTVVIDIAQDDALIADGNYSDRFLVYNKQYNPEDYVLTHYTFSAEDLTRKEEETDEAFQQRAAAYLEQYPNTIWVEAQPECIQHENAPDTDLIKADGAPLYAQRSMMPTGYLLRAWEEAGYTKAAFTNEHVTVTFDMADLHTGQTPKLLALMQAMTGERSFKEIAAQATLDERGGLEQAGLVSQWTTEIDLDAVNLAAIKDYRFGFDGQAEGEDLLADEVFEQMLFEVRITPILPEALEDMLLQGFQEESALQRDVLMLANRRYYQEMLRRWKADGKLSDTECSELFFCMTDGKLTAQELEELQEKAEDGELSYEAVEWLIQAAMDGEMYRVSCWVICNDRWLNITEQMDSMQVLWNAQEQYAQAEQQAESPLEQLEADYKLAVMDDQGVSHVHAQYVPGMHVSRLDVTACMTELQAEESLRSKDYRRQVVDVRQESVSIGGENVSWYRAHITGGTGKLPQACYLAAPTHTSGLVWLAPAK